jgi:hypothetical protein
VARARADVWPAIEAAVVKACDGLEGTLLAQLAELESRLDRVPLDRRAGEVDAGAAVGAAAGAAPSAASHTATEASR